MVIARIVIAMAKMIRLKLAIRNYIENKHEQGEEPTLKQIQSRMKGYDLSCG
jgi:hypothetical protein